MVKASRALPPVSGGTLLVVSGGELVVASDPDRDRISIANFRSMSVEATIALEPRAEPGRLVEDAAKRVHVVLRGTGEVASIDLVTKTLVERRAVCQTPRGIAFERAANRLLVACAQGKLVELPASGGGITRTSVIDVDVRDVVFASDRLHLTRFRSAELLELDADRAIGRRQTLPAVTEVSLRDVNRSTVSLVPNIAWRAVPGPNGSTVIVHQRALSDAIPLATPGSPLTTAPPPAGVPKRDSSAENVASARAAIVVPSTDGRSPYGSSGNGCGGIVHSAISIVDADGSVATSRALAGIVLPVDVAVSPTGTVFVAAAGGADPTVAFGASFSFAAYTLDDLRGTPDGDTTTDPEFPCLSPKLSESGVAAVAVAYVPESGAFLVQTREPALIVVIDPFSSSSRRLSLGGDSVADTGHDLFHADSGFGIACASCHPEGTEDGHTWKFAEDGPRRTQPLDVGLRDTAPFHWDGSLPDLGALMDEVFTRRMGGFRQDPDRVLALEEFIAGFEPRAPVRSAADAAAVRGKALFESPLVGCATCHSGARYSDNATAAIGKGDLPTQTPSLIGVAYRAPYMHDGCAATLRARFEPECGGTEHGNLAGLGPADLDDLVAYLESL